AADPLNLSSLITAGQRVPMQPNHRLLYRDGVPIASSAGKQITFLETIDPNDEWRIRNLLLRKHNPTAFHTSPRQPV
ncbi:MAG: hypothetical protein HKM94_03615, partial [Halobacteria archaeon]|nr:hypothetical protein [Halobacteria archaeon]